MESVCVNVDERIRLSEDVNVHYYYMLLLSALGRIRKYSGKIEKAVSAF